MSDAADRKLVNLLREAERILVFTGAGISTGSGIPDYRGPKGIWTYRQPVYYQDFMASQEARVEYWSQKLEDWDAFRDARPNTVHKAIVDLERAGRLEMVVTQNIDGLHQRAGTSEQRLVEIHGTNAAVECQGCHRRSDPEPHFVYFGNHRRSPICEVCGGFLKSATISFGQSLREEDLKRAAQAAASSDLVISLGSTLSVYPAAAIPLEAAASGVPYVIVNLGATGHDGHPAVSLRLEGDVGALFPPAVEEVVSERIRRSW